MRHLPLIACALALSGCWIVDELDSGMEIMEQHSKREEPAEVEQPAEPDPRPAAKNDGPGAVERLVGWVEKRFEPAPPPPDPADDPVRCQLPGRDLFSTRGDCEARGGRVIELPPE